MKETALPQEAHFAFGENWARFLTVITEERIQQAEASLREMLALRSLEGKKFLDIGCGSGLFSLAARRLGAQVCSFDFDVQSVACAEALKREHFNGDPAWQIARGSALDASYVGSLGVFDIVYSWGVLHHTGNMWRAIEISCTAVAPDGQLFIAIYNDQGATSRCWRAVKRAYNQLPRPLRLPYLLLFGLAFEVGAVGVSLLRLQPRRIVDRWMRYQSVRGMSRWHDLVDWIGGYPFEVATPDAIVDFCRARGFQLTRLKTCLGRMGCNEFVFEQSQRK